MTTSPAATDRLRLAVATLALAAAAWGAYPHADGNSDGSRLAAVESVGRTGRLRIDDSIYLRPRYRGPDGTPAYSDANPYMHSGTTDRMLVGGHYYSHHPPVPLLAGGLVYAGWLAAGGPAAADRPALFARAITVATAGLPFAVAVWLVGRTARRPLGLPSGSALLVSGSLAAATVAPAYSRSVNGHVLLLAVGAGVCHAVAAAQAGGLTARLAAAIGGLAGLGYGADGALGPALVLAATGFCLARGGWRSAAVCGLLAVPGVAAHHLALYVTTGDPLSPATNPANFQWPGSPWTPDALTGLRVKHTAAGAIDYAARLAVGSRGFLTCNPPVWLAVVAAVLLALRHPADRPAVGFAAGWVLLGATPYILLSNNLSGVCLSVRWFVPFLAPAYLLVALLLRRHPGFWRDLAWLSACGAVLGVAMFRAGPWGGETPVVWQVVVPVALVGWAVIRGVSRSGPPAGRGAARSAAAAGRPR